MIVEISNSHGKRGNDVKGTKDKKVCGMEEICMDRPAEIPYDKIVYVSREREVLIAEAVAKLKSDIHEECFEKVEQQLWKTLCLLEDTSFQTAKGLNYFYKIKGNEIFFSRKEKSVTRASVSMALKKALELQKEGIIIKGPKMLKIFGASYIYPVFIKIGVIDIGNE